MTSGCSMKAMIRIGPVRRGQTRGSTSYTCLISRAQARFAADAETSLNYKRRPRSLAYFKYARMASIMTSTPMGRDVSSTSKCGECPW